MTTGFQPVQRTILASQLKQKYSSKILSFPSNIGSHGLLMIFKKYNFQDPGSRGLLNFNGEISATSETYGSVLLPIPASLIDSNGVRIGRNDFTNPAAEAAAKAGSGDFAGIYNDALGFAKSAGSGQALYYTLRRMFYDSELMRAVDQGAGKTINPKAALALEGVEMREFAFEWLLSPNDRSETNLLSEIVNFLKQNILPSYGLNNTNNTRVLLNYPSTVDMYLVGVNKDHYLKFKPAMVRNLSINYTPNGLSILKGGAPSAINLSMQLMEMDIHVAEDYGFTAPDIAPEINAGSLLDGVKRAVSNMLNFVIDANSGNGNGDGS